MHGRPQETHWGMRMARYSSGTAVMISTSLGALASEYLYEACTAGRAIVMHAFSCRSCDRA